MKKQSEQVKKQLELVRIFKPPHPLNRFETQKQYQNELKFNGADSINNLPKIKGGVYLINLDECKSIGTYWIDLYVNGDNLIYFESSIV